MTHLTGPLAISAQDRKTMRDDAYSRGPCTRRGDPYLDLSFLMWAERALYKVMGENADAVTAAGGNNDQQQAAGDADADSSGGAGDRPHLSSDPVTLTPLARGHGGPGRDEYDDIQPARMQEMVRRNQCFQEDCWRCPTTLCDHCHNMFCIGHARRCSTCLGVVCCNCEPGHDCESHAYCQGRCLFRNDVFGQCTRGSEWACQLDSTHTRGTTPCICDLCAQRCPPC